MDKTISNPQPDSPTPGGVDPVVAAVDKRIRLEVIRQLDLFDSTNLDSRIDPLWVLADGLTAHNGDQDDDPPNGLLDSPPSQSSRVGGPTVDPSKE